MSKEEGLIKIIANQFLKSKNQMNKIFESDAEIIKIGNHYLYFNIDEFSKEDMFREHNPYVLGRNMAIGGLSDLYASGAVPMYFGHSMVVDSDWNEDYITRLSKGIADVLKEAGVSFIGGDFGVSNTWRYTVVVIGEGSARPLLRSNANIGDSLYVTGEIGKGNIEAFFKMYSEKKGLKPLLNTVKTQFQLRNKEAEIIRDYSRCCIDTSDGLLNGLNSICKMSDCGFRIRKIPYASSGKLLCKTFSLPEPMMMVAECGEYELLFTIGKEKEEAFLNMVKDQGFTFLKIGEITDKDSKVLELKNKKIDFYGFNIRARDYEDIKKYVEDLKGYF